MATVQRVREAFAHLLESQPASFGAMPVDQSELFDAVRLDRWTESQLTAVAEALEAERTNDFFTPDHFQRTLPLKRHFDVELRRAYCRLMRAVFPPAPFSGASEALRTEDPDQIDAATACLEHDGYHVWPTTLGDQTCDSIAKSLRQVRFRVKSNGQLMDGFCDRNIYRPAGNTCWVVDPQEILRIPEVQSLACDPTLLNVIQNYLGCPPIHVQANCWWSINHSQGADTHSADAQLFHQDLEFIRFVKVFVYLNDVTDLNGPHVYVAGSARDFHAHVPPNYEVSQRLSDAWIAGEYPPERQVVLRGPRGTIVLEDTSGFHKGLPIQCGYRLMLQLEYCCSLFFNPLPSFTFEGLGEPLCALARRQPRTFLSYDHERYLEARTAREARIAAERASQVPPPKRGIGQQLRNMIQRRSRGA